MRKQSSGKPTWYAREWLELKGKKQADVVASTGHNKSEVSQWVSGKRRFNADVLAEFAKVIGCAPADLLRLPAESAAAEARLVGKVGAGAEVNRFDDGNVLEGVPLLMDNAPNAAEIAGDSQYPLQEGWLIFYGAEHAGVPDECIGQLCVLQVKDGPTLLKILKRGTKKGHFRLESWNAPPREDVRVEWAAKVRGIRPK